MDNKRLDEAVEVALRARVPGGAAVKDWLPSADDRGEVPHEVAVSVVRAAILASHPVLLDDLDTVVQQMTDYLDQDVEPDFDVIERWRDTLTAIYAPSLGEGDGR